MPDIPFAGALPAPVHRAVLRVVERLRSAWWRIARPHLRGCAVVVFDRSGRVLLVRHSYRRQNEWHVPTGGVSRTEAVEEAARRELGEEVGMTVGAFTEVHSELVPMHGARNFVTVLAATSDDPPAADQREIAEARFHPADELPAATPPWTRRYVALAREAIARTAP